MSAPSYPLTLPTTTGIAKSSWGLQRAVGVSTSPFTGSQQVYEHDFALWKATITLPPMNRATSADYQTFFMQLHGRKGTFLMGDPDANAKRGTATLQIEPSLKVAITSSTACSITNTVGVWRMDTNELNWDSNHASTYGFSFSCMEAI